MGENGDLLIFPLLREVELPRGVLLLFIRILESSLGAMLAELL